jgi:hypothetical protein
MKRQEKQQGNRNLTVYLVLKTPQEKIEEIKKVVESYFKEVYTNDKSYYIYCEDTEDSIEKVISELKNFPEVQSFDVIDAGSGEGSVSNFNKIKEESLYDFENSDQAMEVRNERNN